MNAATVVLIGGGLVVLGWALHRLGHVLKEFFEAVAVIAVVFVTAWLVLKALWWSAVQIVRHWRTSLTTVAVAAWWYWLGWPSLVIILSVIALGLAAWRWSDLGSFEPWAGRHLRSWRLRWVIYARRMPHWLRACGLSVRDSQQSVTINVNPLRRSAMVPTAKPP